MTLPSQPVEQKRCPYCRRLLFKAAGTDARVEIKCTCSRIVTVAIGKEGGA
jgi:phage FluMu protein Com